MKGHFARACLEMKVRGLGLVRDPTQRETSNHSGSGKSIGNVRNNIGDPLWVYRNIW